MADKTEIKTLAFCFDGTSNDPGDAGGFKEDESITNILKLHILMGGGVAEDRSPAVTPSGQPQTAFYYNGIGAREGTSRIPLLGKLYHSGRSLLNMAVAPSFGDAKRILDDAKADFDGANYQAGDTLVIFGYSRGAALARKFAATLLRDHKHCKVSFLGVFDTVAAMNGIHRKGDKISSDVVFEDGTLHPRIERAVHLVAVDENRVSFTPTLMNKDAKNPDRILEVWFPGVHGDVGGGCWADGLSDNALAFMIDRCKETLGDAIAIADGEDPASIRRLLAQQDDALAGLDADDIAIHPLINGPLHAHNGAMAAILGEDVRSICVSDNDRPSKAEGDLPILHESVGQRFIQVPDYRPAALRGLKFRLWEGGKVGEETIEGVSGLRAHCRLNQTSW